MKEKRKKNLSQGFKKSGSKNIKPDIWKRTNFEPHWKLKSIMRKENNERRMRMPDGPGTHRASGSNARLKKYCY